jgi:RNA polymerase sigma-70 factor, ECF subfamily
MTLRDVYDTHLDFVWRSLNRLGVPSHDLPDATQDVFLVVHRRLGEFEGRAKMTTWLFRICMRVASDRRRASKTRREVYDSDEVARRPDERADSAAELERKRDLLELEAILAELPDDQRLVFALFELDGLTGEQIAELLEVPLGTVRSRLRLGRQGFDQALGRRAARQRSFRLVAGGRHE